MDRIELHRRYLNQGGYDTSGTYWGNDGRHVLYDWHDPKDGWRTLRATSRDNAKSRVRDYYPEAQFYR